MTIHKIKDEFVLKASIGELLAALDGIVCAGVTVAKQGQNTATGIASAGYNAASLSYDMRERLSFKRISAEAAASKITDYLDYLRKPLSEKSDIVLSLPHGKTGGTLQDVLSHIEDILMREKIGGERPSVRFENGGLKEKFKAPYLPAASKADLAEPEFDGDDEVIAEPEVKQTKAKRGPKKAYTWGRAAALV